MTTTSWIDLKDKSPSPIQTVLAFAREYSLVPFMAGYNGEEWLDMNNNEVVEEELITHWMPIHYPNNDPFFPSE